MTSKVIHSIHSGDILVSYNDVSSFELLGDK